MTARKASSNTARADSIRISDLIYAQDGTTRCRVVRVSEHDGTVRLTFAALSVRGHATRTRATIDVPADSMVHLAGQL